MLFFTKKERKKKRSEDNVYILSYTSDLAYVTMETKSIVAR